MEEFIRPTPPAQHRPRVIPKHYFPDPPYKSRMDHYAEYLKKKAAEEAARPKKTPEQIASEEARYWRRWERQMRKEERAMVQSRTEEARPILHRTDRVILYRFIGERGSAAITDYFDEEARSITHHFLEEKALGWASKCVFEPGGKLLFLSDVGATEIVVCFKCDDVLITHDGEDGDYFGMSDKLRGFLVNLFKTALPNDEAIQAINEKEA